MKRTAYIAPSAEPKNPLEANLHDLANAIAAARSFGEVLHHRGKTTGQTDVKVIGQLLAEIDRASDILLRARRETFRPGDVLQCKACGYSFVHRKAAGKPAACRRCKSAEVERWRGKD